MERSEIWMVFIDNGYRCKWRLDSGLLGTEIYPLSDVYFSYSMKKVAQRD